MKLHVSMVVNSEDYEVEVEPRKVLLTVMRDSLELIGTKEGCGTGDCGACTVIMNGQTVNSCLVLGVEADGANIVTIEGIDTSEGLSPVQEAIVKFGGIQCGFCTPGIIVSAKALLDENRDPNEEEIRKGIAGNLCRCTGYSKIVEAIQDAARLRRETIKN